MGNESRCYKTHHISFSPSQLRHFTVNFGIDIYTVSKMLGHKHLKTTQVYAKVIDQKKQEAANKIKLEL